MNPALPDVESNTVPLTSNIVLEVWRQPESELLHFPLQVMSLSGKGAVLQGGEIPEGFSLQDLEGQEGLLLILGEDKADDLEIPSKVLEIKPGPQGAPEFQVALELDDPDRKGWRALEKQLPSSPKDMKQLWDSWDQVHQEKPAPNRDQAFYLVGLAAVAGGLIMHFTAPESVKVWGSLVAIYGSLMIAGKSIWNIWHKPVSRERL